MVPLNRKSGRVTYFRWIYVLFSARPYIYPVPGGVPEGIAFDESRGDSSRILELCILELQAKLYHRHICTISILEQYSDRRN